MYDTIGRYEVVKKLGEGGLGSVYLAQDPAIGRKLAVKVIRATGGVADLPARILREVRVFGKLSHPNIITLYDVGQIEDKVYIATEFVDGEDLSSRMFSGGLRPDEVRQVLSSVAAALDYAHGLGIVHRDIKPSNIMIARDGVVKVVDFGIARAVSEAQEASLKAITRDGIAVGSVGFMSPEQIEGRSPYNRFERSVFTWCCFLRAFDGTDAVRIFIDSGDSSKNHTRQPVPCSFD